MCTQAHTNIYNKTRLIGFDFDLSIYFSALLIDVIFAMLATVG